MLCIGCSKETDNPKFCSRSCSASYSNRKVAKRLPEGNCYKCFIPIKKSRKYCKQCFKEERDAKDMTLEEASKRYNQHHQSSAFGLVRNRARELAKKLNWNSCKICGYSTHIEIAHIKPISSFPNETLISIINNESNLVPLCPNHHWEFDNKVITLSS